MEELQTIKHNHIKIPINSVIFDIDCHLRVISDKIHDFISSNLIKDNISHQVWDTSRSPHIHCFFNGLNLYPKEVRRDIRLLILKYYSQDYFKWIDKSKASEDVMIRDFNSIHEITGKPKTLIYEYVYPHNNQESPLNALNSTILEQLRVLYHQHRKVPDISQNSGSNAVLSLYQKKELMDFVDFCLNNTLIQDGKKMYLSKNIAIACLLLSYSYNERIRIYHRVNQNSRSIILSNLIGWDKYFGKRDNIKVNWGEVKLWFTRETRVTA